MATTFTEDGRSAPLVDRGPGENIVRIQRTGRWALTAALILAIFWGGGTSHGSLGLVILLGIVAWVGTLFGQPHRPPVSRFAWLWLLLGLYTCLQLIPIPRQFLLLLHPRAVSIHDAGSAALGIEPSALIPIAVAWGDAAMQAMLYLAVGAIGMIWGSYLMHRQGRLESRQVADLITWAAVISGTCWMLGYHQNVAWRLPAEVRELFQAVSFRNPNHEAGLMNVGLAIAFATGIREQTTALLSPQTLAAYLGLLVLMSGSRGGIAAALFVVLLVLAYRPTPKEHRRPEGARERERLQRIVLSTLSVLIVLALIAMPVLEEEFGLTGRPQDMSKLRMLGDIPSLMDQGWLFGQAPGTIPVVAGMTDKLAQYRVDFLENIIADRLVGGGLWGGLLFLLALAWMTGKMSLKRQRGSAFPMWLGMSALLAQNLVDFSLETGGGLMVFLVTATLAERLQAWRKPDDDEERERVRRSAIRTKRASVVMSGGGLAIAAMLWLATDGNLTRDVDTRLAELDAKEFAAQVGASFLHDHHAFYVLGRKRLDAGDAKGAVAVLNRAVELRPHSHHAHLSRMAAHLGAGEIAKAGDDAVWLLSLSWDAPNGRKTFMHTLATLGQIDGGDKVLMAAIPRLTKQSEAIGTFFMNRRPGLVEKLALILRDKYPDRRFSIEGLRGRLYVKRGLFEPAGRISAVLMANKETELAGWMLEATILSHRGRMLEAHHLFHEVCVRDPVKIDACRGAVSTIVAANVPKRAYEYLRQRYPMMRRDPNLAFFFWLSMSSVQAQNGNLDEAVSAAQRALGFRRNDRAALSNLVKLYIELGDRHGAEAALQRLRNDNKQKKIDPLVVQLADAVTRLNRTIAD